jgi:transcriptional regulator with GAF, ATPase, and Fis domain
MAESDFSSEQWDFLAVLAALGGEAAVDVVGILAPLTPGPLFDLINRAKASGLLVQTGPDSFRLEFESHPEARTRLKALNSPAALRSVLEGLERRDLLGRIPPAAVSGLFQAAGRAYEAAAVEEEKAREAALSGRLSQALEHYQAALACLEGSLDEARSGALYVSVALASSRLGFRLGQGLDRLPTLLKKARETAAALGDRRSRVLIGLHMGTFYYLNEALDEALGVMAGALDEVRNLGDEDILVQSAEFFGFYYYLQGRYREAAEYFDRAVQAAERRGDSFLIWPVPAYLGYTAAVLGQFHRAVGIVDANWRRAGQRGETSLAVHFRALLGLVLAMMSRDDEAWFHLQGARREAQAAGQIFNRAMCDFALSYLEFRQGRFEMAHDRLNDALVELGRAGLPLRQYPTPLVLEMLSEFHHRGLAPLPLFTFKNERDRLLKGVNVHLKGVAHRCLARELSAREDFPQSVMDHLTASEDCLDQSGDPLELARTRVDLARHHLTLDRFEEARRLALKAWEGLSGSNSEAFPDDLRFLVEGREGQAVPYSATESLIQRLFEMINQLAPCSDQGELLGRQVAALCRLFRAERGGLFWFSEGKSPGPWLRAGRNLDEAEVQSREFRSNLALVFKSFRANQPVLVRPRPLRGALSEGRSISVICLPIDIKGRTSGVLYLDNSYLELDLAEEKLLTSLSGQVGGYFERGLELGRLSEERERLASVRLVQEEGAQFGDILAKSPAMTGVMALADRAAASEATVLLLGETGVGKELLARRIHLQSPRRHGPFITVDLASTPEGLVESELFGHEKGAFTGADRTKPGRLELAHQGTLFLDELGEIPRAVQVKLLRAIQEKTFVRLGGTRSQSSDFRVVAATNRDLAAEVAAGRFRQDLYYRLNVVPLTVPPLRHRGEDVLFLARHFVRKFAVEFNRPEVALTAGDEVLLSAYHWPGNIRELRNVIERAVLLSEQGRLLLSLPGSTGTQPEDDLSDWPSWEDMQRRYLKRVLEKTGGKIGGPGGAAEILGLKRTSLNARLRKLGLTGTGRAGRPRTTGFE